MTRRPKATTTGPESVRPDPVRDAVPGQEVVYEALQTVWSAWARRRYRDEFSRVTSFCLFIGYPRSGHSLLGAMLNAHPHAVISHELDVSQLVLGGASRDELFSRILARAAWFNLRGNRSNYRYQIPNKWQGRFTTLRVIGDKRGGTAAQSLVRHPDLLDRLRQVVGVPVRLIHVVRNPYDNIAAIARWHRLTLDASIEFYFSHFSVTGKLEALAPAADIVTVRHEAFFSASDETLSSVCSFLGLEASAGYLQECSSIVFRQPTSPRFRIEWTAAQLADVASRAREYPFLAGYTFDEPNEADVAARERSVAPRAKPPANSHVLDRLAAFLRPRVSAGRSGSQAGGSSLPA